MVEHVTIILDHLRGGGFLLDSRGVDDFTTADCDLVERSDVIGEETVTVYRVSNGVSEGYSVTEIMHLLSSNLVKNPVFLNNQIRYDSYSPSEITSMDDLNGVVVGLRYSDNRIVYDTFESQNALLYDSDLEILAGAVTNLRYTDYSIRYDVVGEINE